MSQALYRQYRPQKFGDVVGQDVAVRTLRNAIEQDRVAHAYLFTGTKGTGKTTLAKLLAKAMNCVNGPTVEPCGVCEECVSIAEGRSMDVAEIDAASNTGIDTVREKIIDTVAFQPSRGSRRVYIIDEAHQLSKAAFNALLKTIEEPPPHVMFVFCTTETHLMMATVRDRCQRIAMRSPGPDALVEALNTVCAGEGITSDEPALRAIARAAQGSFRNALGTLEMLTTTFGPTFSRDDVLQHLGVVSEETLFEMSDAIIDARPADVLRLIERLTQDGVDLEQFARALAEHLRAVLLQLHGVAEVAVVGDTTRLAQQAERADERRVLAAIDCIADATTRIRVGSDARIAIETALVRACLGLGLPLLAMRLAALEQAASGSYGQPVSGATPAAAPAPLAAVVVPPIPANPVPAAVPAAMAPAPSASTPAPTPPTPAAAPTPAGPTPIGSEQLAAVGDWWPRVAQRISPAFRPLLGQITAEAATATKLVLRHGSVPVTAKLREALVTATLEVTGHRLAVELVPIASPAPASGAAPTAPATAGPTSVAPPASAPIAAPGAVTSDIAPVNATPDLEDEGVANLMSMFDATPVAPGGDTSDQ